MAKNKPIKLITVRHPVDNADRDIRYIPYHRQRLKTLARKYMPDNEDLIVHVNQNRLTKIEQKTYRLKPGDEVIMVPALRGGFIAGIGTVIGAIGKALAGKYGVGWLIASNVAIAVGTGYLMSMLGPKPKSAKLDGLGPQSESFSWNPHTVQKQGLVISRGYGKVKQYGNIISAYTVADGEDETIYLILGLSEGPVKGIVAGSIRINDQPVGNFDNVITYERRGTLNQTAIYDQAKPEYRPQRKVTYDGGAETWTTPDNDYDDLEITLEYRLAYLNDSGGYSSSSMGVKIEISETGQGSWSTLVNTTLNNSSSTPQKKTYIASENYAGGSPVTINNGTRSDIKVTKTTSDKGTRYLDDLKISAVREVIDIAFVQPGLSQLGIKALATDQISGNINVSCIQEERVINCYNGTAWEIKYSTNPAWVIWDLMTQPVIGGDGEGTAYAIERYDGVDPSRLTPYLSEYYLAAEWFDQMVPDGQGGTEKRIEFNGQFDAGTNTRDAVQDVCRMAKCEAVPVGRNYTIIVDKAWTDDIVQLFSAGNIKPGTFRRDYLPLGNRAAVIENWFLDEDQDYSRDEPVVLYIPAINTSKKISLKKIGITKRSQAWRDTYYELAKNELIKSIVTFDADIDAIVSMKGDVIYVASPWKKDGRVVSCSANNKVVLDKSPSPSGADKILIKTFDATAKKDKVEVHTVSSVEGAEVTIADTWSYTPKNMDVYAFGPADKITEKFKIIGIKEKEELVHTIIAGEYHTGLYIGDEEEPVLPMGGYVAPQVAPDRTSMITLAELRAEYPKEVLGLSNIDTPITTDIVFTS